MREHVDHDLNKSLAHARAHPPSSPEHQLILSCVGLAIKIAIHYSKTTNWKMTGLPLDDAIATTLLAITSAAKIYDHKHAFTTIAATYALNALRKTAHQTKRFTKTKVSTTYLSSLPSTNSPSTNLDLSDFPLLSLRFIHGLTYSQIGLLIHRGREWTRQLTLKELRHYSKCL